MVQMMKKNNGNTILIVGVLALVAFGIQSEKNPGSQAPQPTKAGLIVILDAFAWNIEQDGKLDQPLITYSNHLGEAFNEFGRRSTLGQSYRTEFGQEFDQLAVDLKNALDVDPGVPGQFR